MIDGSGMGGEIRKGLVMGVCCPMKVVGVVVWGTGWVECGGWNGVVGYADRGM